MTDLSNQSDISSPLEPTLPETEALAATPRPENYDRLAESDLFNAQWYLENNSDVANSGTDPLEHYLLYGGLEGRPASPEFHSAGYYALNTDVAKAGVHPLVHYLISGRDENRQIMTVAQFVNALGSEEEADSLRDLVVSMTAHPLFDPEWFIQNYPELNARDPLAIIRILASSELPLNPGPGFDASAYLQDHQDVAAQKARPFVHYVRWGQAEGRIARPVGVPGTAQDLPQQQIAAVSEEPEDVDAALIRASQLFDANWYKGRYSDVARAGVEPLVHYMKHGAMELRWPSILFDPVFYMEQLGAEAKSVKNPLLHYVQTGRGAGLKPIALLDASAPSRKIDGSGQPDPLVDLSGFVSHKVSWVAHGRITPAAGESVLMFGNLGLARLAKPSAFKGSWSPLLTFMKLLRATPDCVRFRVAETGRETAAALRFDANEQNRGLGPILSRGRSALSDIWFTAEARLRLRLGAEPVTEDEPENVVLRAFQADLADPTRLRLVGEGLVSGDPSFVDLLLDNSYAPVLLIVTTTDGTLLETGLLPFPSLARGGVHSGELQALGEKLNLRDDFRSFSDAFVRELLDLGEESNAPAVLSGIVVRPEGALGSERIFSPEVREWLRLVFGVSVTSAPTGGDSDISAWFSGDDDLRMDVIRRSELRAENALLFLPPDAIPTLTALSNRRIRVPQDGTSAIGAYITADAATGRARHLVSLPEVVGQLAALQPSASFLSYPTIGQPADRAEGAVTERAAFPLAIRFPAAVKPTPAAQLMPHAPDSQEPILRLGVAASAPAISVVLRGADRASSKKAVEALAAQTGVSITDVTVLCARQKAACTPELAAHFPGRFIIEPATRLPSRDIARACAKALNEWVLMLDAETVLHDSRTLATLAMLIAQDGVASAACGRLRETVAKKRSAIQVEAAGFFPSSISLIARPQLVLSQPNVFNALPQATYPVIANDFEGTLVRKSLLQRCAQADSDSFTGERFALQFAVSTCREGWTHLCTTGIRMTSIRARNQADEIDPLGAHLVMPERWQDLLSRVTLVRELI